jgi:hypothetical protein
MSVSGYADTLQRQRKLGLRFAQYGLRAGAGVDNTGRVPEGLSVSETHHADLTTRPVSQKVSSGRSIVAQQQQNLLRRASLASRIGERRPMFLIRYLMSRIFVFWASVSILVYGWFNHPKLVNDGFGASEALVKSLSKVDESGKAETVIVHILHLGDLFVIGIIMLVVTLAFTALRNLVVGSSERRMTLARAVGHVVTLLVLAYVVLAAVWWYDARLVNAWFDASRALLAQVAASIDPRGQVDLVLRSLGVSRHLVVACLMLAIALVWETVKWMARGARARLARSSP